MIGNSLSRLARFLGESSFIKVAEELGKLSILVTLVSLAVSSYRDFQTGESVAVLTAWSLIGNAHGKPGDLGRKRAVVELNKRGICMQDINLSSADLNGVKLSRPNFYHGKFVRTTFVGASISHSNFRAADLNCANFVDATLVGSNLSGSDLGNTNFKNADLRGVDFRNAHFGQAACKYMKPFDTFLGGAKTKIAGADFRGAKGITCETLQRAPDWELSVRNEECGKPIPPGLDTYHVQGECKN